MSLPVLNLGGHIGNTVSALVDGQLSEPEEERAWQHVLGCPGCRRLVEREGWVKTRVATLSAAEGGETPPTLLGSLYDVDAWADMDRLERASMRRRAVAAVVGVGSLGFAVLGIVAATTPPAGRGEVPGSPLPSMIRSEVSGAGAGAGLGVGLGAGLGSGLNTGVGDHARLSARDASR